MFRNTLRMLEQLNGTMTYKMDVLPDEDGYYDKECPNEKCLSKFKHGPRYVLETLWYAIHLKVRYLIQKEQAYSLIQLRHCCMPLVC